MLRATQRRRRILWLGGLFLIGLRAAPGVRAAEIQIEGPPELVIDREALDLLLAAQETNLAAFNKGRMKVHYEKETGAAQKLTLDGVFTWDGDRLHVRYSYQGTRGGKEIESQLDARRIETPKEVLWYEPRYKLATRNPFHKRSTSQPQLCLLPRECWFHGSLASPRNWTEVLPPPSGTSYTKRYELSQSEPTIVEWRGVPWVGGHWLIRFDLAQGGNAIYREVVHASVDLGVPIQSGTEKVTWKWLPDSRGQFRLQEMSYRSEHESGELDVSHLIQVQEFDPDPVIDAKVFTVDGLEIAPGTVFEDRTKPNHQRTIIGQPDKVVVNEADLARRAEELRSRGFTARTREESP
jgi:hypothetical protein